MNNTEITEKTTTPNLRVEIDKTKPVDSQVKEYVNALAMEKALQDERLTQELTEKARQKLVNNAEAELKSEKAENTKADVEIQQAQYGAFEGVAKYAGISHHLPLKMQQIIFTILSVIQGIFLILFGIPVSVINIVVEQVDSVVTKLNSVAKSVRRIMLSSFVIGIVALIIFLVYTFFVRR